MTNMRRGFTMIELIFVIVIIGILAAVAIPKLAATRDDAKVSNIIANTRTGLGDVTSFYTSKGSDYYENNATVSEVTNIAFKTAACVDVVPGSAWYGNQYYLCDGTDTCIEFDANDTITITLTDVATAEASPVCDGVTADPAIVIMTDGAIGKAHRLGGSQVIR